MEDNELSPEQRARIEALVADFEHQLARVHVDLRAASPQMHEVAPPVERTISDDETEVEFTIDVSGIVETLRRLPDGAGTSAFVTAYNAAHQKFRGPTA